MTEEFLKGNYRLPERGDDPRGRENPSESLEERFEAAAFQKLGGSIAFVKKSGSFIWKGTKNG